ncbi:tryptophan-rich sensory protein [Hoeflea sp. WL0058]|uniref:Tryptophan-rich sensory protein n=2 Tax=Flavimaribacter sediminis TaxID=2865987 RepID=A0AAE2ZMR4_9HYPH|nr:tryptophan-rich sensory protein [Flavimaribacter sediminis]
MKLQMALVVFLILVAFAASGGVFFRPGTHYEALKKPTWTPPNRVFPVAWTILYIMIAIAGWLVWRAEGAGAALWFWVIQLVLNGVWSWFFFGRKDIRLALYDILLLLAMIVAFIIAAAPTSTWAALLFLPYLAWVGFATALNWRIFQLNGRRPAGSQG